MGSLFDPGPAVSGSKSHGQTWKYCPYSTQITAYNQDSRVPEGEKVYHGETEGKMFMYSIGSPGPGWVCVDNDCPYYTGVASTAVDQYGTKFVIASGTHGGTEQDLATLSGTVQPVIDERTIPASGSNTVRYFEI